MTTVGRIAFVALAPVLLVWALLAAELSTTSRPVREAIATPHPVSVGNDSAAVSPRTVQGDTQQPLVDEGETDLYGNEVDDAVAEYGLDAAGSLYEMHAPQVELPHLASPKS